MPPPQPPQRSGSPVLVLVLVLVGGVVVALGIVGVILFFMFRGGADGPEPTPGGTGEVGETVTADRLEYVVQGVDTGVEIPGHTPNGEYVVVHVDVYNHSGSTEDFWADEQVLYTDDGDSHHFDEEAYLDHGDNAVLEDLPADGELQSALVYDVPDATAITSIGLSEETTGGNELDVDLSSAVSDAGTGDDSGGGQSQGEDMVGIGETAERERLDFVVTGVDRDADISGHTPNGEYVVVNVDVYNHSGSTEDFWADEQVLYTDDGDSHHFDENAYLDHGDNAVWEDVPAGETLETAVVFDVPDAGDLSHIGLSEETYGENEIDVELSD